MKKPRKEPTIKQKKAAQFAVENGGNITQAMRDAGYSEATINNPSNLTGTTTWQELMDKHLPDDTLLTALAEDIKRNKGKRTSELQLAFKLKGKMLDKAEVVVKEPPLSSAVDNDRAAYAA